MKALLAVSSLIFLASCLTSCASYVQALHKQIDKDKNKGRQQVSGQNSDPYGRYQQQRYSREGDRMPIQNPKTLGGYPSTSEQKNVYPQVKRNYGSARTKADDLKDNGGDGSLWSGKNADNYLFVTNNIKNRGDIVIIEVLSKMKDDITEELKRNFPEPVKKKAKDDEEKKEEDAPEETAEAQPKPGDSKEVHDKISTQVVELINKDYLLVRGRKQVIFRKAKRYIEVQALVSRKDITDNDTVASDRVLEPKIRALRY